jgi:large subunit ribosomal protein L24
MGSLNVKKGDRVIVIAGKDKGKKGEVLSANPSESRVVVQGVNVVKKHRRATPSNPGGIIEQEAAIHVSNVAHLDPRDDKPTRIGSKVLDDGRKVRVAKRSGETIDR